VPAAYCYLHYRWRAGEPQFCEADTNGCAVGSTRDEAIVRALLELLERDAAATWWYNRLRRPAVNLGELEARRYPGYACVAGDARTLAARLGPEWRPSDICRRRRFRRTARRSHRLWIRRSFRSRSSALAAVSEMHQFAAQATLLERLASEGRAPTLSSDVVVFMEWWRSQFLADHPHLVPTQTRAPAGSSHYDIADSEADLERIVRELNTGT